MPENGQSGSEGGGAHALPTPIIIGGAIAVITRLHVKVGALVGTSVIFLFGNVGLLG